MKIFFYAFGNTPYIFNEVIKLSKQKNINIEWGMIYPRYVYKDTAINLIDKDNILYLFDNFTDYYKNIKYEDVFFEEKNWIDNIYTIIESSKFGYKKKSSKKQLKVAYVIYKIYKEFLLKRKPDYVIFPDIETVNGALLLNICKELGIEVMVTVETRQLGESFFAKDYRETLPDYFGTYNKKDIIKADNFVNNPIKKAIIANQINDQFGDQQILVKPKENIFKRFIRSIVMHYKYEKYGIFDTNLYLRIRLNFEKYFEIWRKFYFNFFQEKYFDLKNLEKYPDNYILLLLQVTPESSINTYSQYFIEQERVIDLIRLNMPSNFKLLIKEHPAMRGMRSIKWYKKMNKKAGVYLVSHKIDTKLMIQKSKLVVTVTGSVGIECYHFDKPCLMFGQTFFSHLLDRFYCIDQIKNQINDLIFNKTFDSKDKKIVEIAKIYNISYDFFIHEPFHFERVMKKSNINNFLNAIQDHIKRLKECDNV
jgi:hypothetical protein